MAWLRVNDMFVNLDHVGSIVLQRTSQGWMLACFGPTGQSMFVWDISEADIEKIMRAIEYATQPVKIRLLPPPPEGNGGEEV